MGFEETIRGLGQVAWSGEPGPQSAKPGSARGLARGLNPTGAQTPKEALTYIELLYKAGRMEDLAGLLRQSSVFREAWLALQSSPGGFGAAGGSKPSAILPGETPGPAGLTALSPDAGSPGLKPNPDQSLAEPKGAALGELYREIAAPSTAPEVQNYPVPAPQPSRPLATGRRVYENQQRYYSREQELRPRINVRV